jgi:hypothetical protein
VWTTDLDWTGAEASLAVTTGILFGPLNIFIGLILLSTVAFGKTAFANKVIKERRNK